MSVWSLGREIVGTVLSWGLLSGALVCIPELMGGVMRRYRPRRS
jgi:hypothetical protein